mmetsp:Transcript_45603/g.108515  ORF Transcript_45603/g.108515 Transcript_45603/m.108515 type:complete len:211 (+) Transcript_45603:2591-3223(+)
MPELPRRLLLHQRSSAPRRCSHQQQPAQKSSLPRERRLLPLTTPAPPLQWRLTTAELLRLPHLRRSSLPGLPPLRLPVSPQPARSCPQQPRSPQSCSQPPQPLELRLPRRSLPLRWKSPRCCSPAHQLLSHRWSGRLRHCPLELLRHLSCYSRSQLGTPGQFPLLAPIHQLLRLRTPLLPLSATHCLLLLLLHLAPPRFDSPVRSSLELW